MAEHLPYDPVLALPLQRELHIVVLCVFGDGVGPPGEGRTGAVYPDSRTGDGLARSGGEGTVACDC